MAATSNETGDDRIPVWVDAVVTILLNLTYEGVATWTAEPDPTNPTGDHAYKLTASHLIPWAEFYALHETRVMIRHEAWAGDRTEVVDLGPGHFGLYWAAMGKATP